MQTASFALSFTPFVFAQSQFDPQNSYIVISRWQSTDHTDMGSSTDSKWLVFIYC